ncbi:MAG: cation diffusion facilitator family transporter [Armatimonadota bacterium]
MAHDDTPQLSTGDLDKSRRLIFAALVNIGIVVVQLLGAVLSGSLALAADAGHNLADVLALLLSITDLRLACRLPTDTRTYGLHRTEIFAAFLNGLALFVIAFFVGREAWFRLWVPPPIQTGLMLGTAVFGLLANWLVMTRLSAHKHDLNLRSAYLHMLGDVLASAGVIVAALVMHFTHRYWVDPVISILIALLILGGAWRLMAESVEILLLGVPRSLEVRKIADGMQAVEGVTDIHNLRLWAVCSNVYVLSAHVVVSEEGEENRVRIRQELRQLLSHDYGVAEATLELEEAACPASRLIHPLEHPEAHEHGTHEH